MLHDQIQEPSDRRGDRGVLTDPETAVLLGIGRQLSPGYLFPLPGIEEKIVVVAGDQPLFRRTLGPEDARDHPVRDIAGGLTAAG